MGNHAKTGRSGKQGARSTGWSGGNPSGFRAKHVLAVRMYAARVAWLHGGAPCWEPDGQIVYSAPDGTRVSLTPEAIARAQYCLNRIAVHTFSARAALGDADAYLARSRAALEVAKRIVAVRDAARRPGEGTTADPATLASLLLLEAEAICDTPFSPARRLALLPLSPAAVAPIRALVGDESLPRRARALAALVMGAQQARRGSGGDDFAASETKAARHPAAVRAAFAFALRRGLTDEPTLIAALLAATDPDAPAGALLTLALRLDAARRAVEGTPFALPASLLRGLLRREGGGCSSPPAAERCVELVEATAEMLPLADRLRRRRHELPLPPAREDAQHAQAARGIRDRAVAELGSLLTAYVRATGGDPEAPRWFASFVRDTLDQLPHLLGPHLDAALLQPLRIAARESGDVASAYLRLLSECGASLWGSDVPGPGMLGKKRSGLLSERVVAAHELRQWLERAGTFRFRPALTLLKVANGDPYLVRFALEKDALIPANYDAARTASWYAWVYRAAHLVGAGNPRDDDDTWSMLTTVADDGEEARAQFSPVLGILAAMTSDVARHDLAKSLYFAVTTRERAFRRAAYIRLPTLLPTLLRSTVREGGGFPHSAQWSTLLHVALRAPQCFAPVLTLIRREASLYSAPDAEWYVLSRIKFAADVAFAILREGDDPYNVPCDSTTITALLDAVRIARAADRDDTDETDIRRGLEALDRVPALRVTLIALMPAQARRCLRLLAGLGAIAHLGSSDDALAPFDALEEGTGDSVFHVAADDPEWTALLALAPDLGPSVADYWYARWLLGEDDGLPAGVRRAALGEAEKRRRELDHLDARIAAGDADNGIAARAASLRERLVDIDGRQRARAADEARERMTAVTREAQMAAAEQLLEECWRARLRVFLGRATTKPVAFTDDLRNALRIGVHIDENRKLLQRLLRAHLAGAARAFLDEHPRNREFLRKLAAGGADADAWQGAHPRRLRLPGSDRPVRLYVEKDPLRVLQMGNTFGTCLAADGFNAFSTVANACEANKRVVYAVDDNTGRIVGRELLGLTEELKLLRFRVYTNVDTPAETDALDAAFRRYVADFAARCRLTTADTGTVPRLIAQDWYDDGAHPWEADAAGRRAGSSLRWSTARRTMRV